MADKLSATPSCQPDLEASQAPQSNQRQTLGQRWTEPVHSKHADLICLILSLITGLCDSAAYNAWSCFLAMQTGNTIFLGLGASNQPTGKPWGWLKSLVSIVFFFIGSVSFVNLTRRFNPVARGTLISSFLVQTILVVIATAIIETNLIPHTSTDVSLTGGRLFLELIPIALLAFQSAGSIACSRALGYNEIPTVVLTSVYFDVASDPKLGAAPSANVKRNRRAGGIVMVLIGAIVGGWLSRSSGGMQSALWMAAGLKFCIGVLWWFWPGSTIKDSRRA